MSSSVQYAPLPSTCALGTGAHAGRYDDLAMFRLSHPRGGSWKLDGEVVRLRRGQEMPLAKAYVPEVQHAALGRFSLMMDGDVGKTIVAVGNEVRARRGGPGADGWIFMFVGGSRTTVTIQHAELFVGYDTAKDTLILVGWGDQRIVEWTVSAVTTARKTLEAAACGYPRLIKPDNADAWQREPAGKCVIDPLEGGLPCSSQTFSANIFPASGCLYDPSSLPAVGNAMEARKDRARFDQELLLDRLNRERNQLNRDIATTRDAIRATHAEIHQARTECDAGNEKINALQNRLHDTPCPYSNHMFATSGGSRMVGTMNQCRLRCDDSAACLGFARLKNANDSAAAECWLKQGFGGQRDYNPANPWRMQVKHGVDLPAAHSGMFVEIRDTTEDGIPRRLVPSNFLAFAAYPGTHPFVPGKCYPVKPDGGQQTFVRVIATRPRIHFGKDVIFYTPVHPSIHPPVKAYKRSYVLPAFQCPGGAPPPAPPPRPQPRPPPPQRPYSTHPFVVWSSAGRDLPGNPRIDTQRNCELACTRDARCVGFSRPRSAPPGARSQCWFKSGLTPRDYNARRHGWNTVVKP